MDEQNNWVVAFDAKANQWWRFDHPAAMVTTTQLSEVGPCLQAVEQAVEQNSWYAAGWISYEAAPAFDPALRVCCSADSFPLLWFGLYPRRVPFELPQATWTPAAIWEPELSDAQYAEAFHAIKKHIHAGHTYQANFSYRLRCPHLADDPWLVFVRLCAAQRPRFGAYLSAGPWRIASASPELFFQLDGSRIISRPMKGTAARGRTTAEDRQQAHELAASEKNRAENLMIVDMARHDLGRVARPGSVQTLQLCAVEKYPTVWQMVSTIAAETSASLPDIFSALFPAASITGAPKARTMQILAELEISPRRVYTGAIGWVAPGRQAQFNVAIRTLLAHAQTGEAEYGVGGGIVWDSEPEAEQRECRTKARILTAPPPPSFCLLETLRWTPEEDFSLGERHWTRWRESAEYFDFPFAEARLREEISALARALPPCPHRVRWLLAADGSFHWEARPLEEDRRCWRVALARRPVDPADVFLYHKTTHRRRYEEARADFPDHDDVLLYNPAGEATESTVANLVVEMAGHRYTPPIECGLLAGTARAEYLAHGWIQERRLTMAELRLADRIYLLNSVRGLVPAQIDWSTFEQPYDVL